MLARWSTSVARGALAAAASTPPLAVEGAVLGAAGGVPTAHPAFASLAAAAHLGPMLPVAAAATAPTVAAPAVAAGATSAQPPHLVARHYSLLHRAQPMRVSSNSSSRAAFRPQQNAFAASTATPISSAAASFSTSPPTTADPTPALPAAPPGAGLVYVVGDIGSNNSAFFPSGDGSSSSSSSSVSGSGTDKPSSSASSAAGGGGSGGGGGALLVLNRPRRLNALTPELGAEFEAAVRSLHSRPSGEVRALVIAGQGGAFSAGGDLDFLEECARDSIENNETTMLAFYRSFLSVRRLPIPVIAAIEGPAVGAGACLALACDVRVAAANARIGFNFFRLGMCTGFGVTQLLPAAVGVEAASRLLLAGDLVSGHEAARIGLVSQVAEAPGTALGSALALARRMAGVSGPAMRPSLLDLRRRAEGGVGHLEAVLEEEARAQAASFVSGDFRAGLAAKRRREEPVFPSWEGR